MLEALKWATNFKHTGLIEMVNMQITKYAPKRTFYKRRAMTAKVCCALLAHNENVNREILLGEDRHPKMRLKKQRYGPARGCVTRVNWKFWVG